MNLGKIRQKFVNLSGHFDLATTPAEEEQWSVDNGADFFIEGACMDLDLETGHVEDRWYEETWVANDYNTELIQKCVAIKQVWFLNTEGNLSQLEKKYLDELFSDYPEQGDTTAGLLTYWSPNIIHRDPSNYSSGADIKYKGILCMPPLETGANVVLGTDSKDYKCTVAHTATTDDRPITGENYADYWSVMTTTAGTAWVEDSSYLSCKIKVFGKFHSLILAANADENYWSVNYPNLLVLACLRNREAFYRNTQGYDDFDRIIKRALRGIDSDLVESLAAEELQMEG